MLLIKPLYRPISYSLSAHMHGNLQQTQPYPPVALLQCPTLSWNSVTTGGLEHQHHAQCHAPQCTPSSCAFMSACTRGRWLVSANRRGVLQRRSLRPPWPPCCPPTQVQTLEATPSWPRGAGGSGVWYSIWLVFWIAAALPQHSARGDDARTSDFALTQLNVLDGTQSLRATRWRVL